MKPSINRFASLATIELSNLANELRDFSDYKLTSDGKGEYVGSILGFVKGLRISAKLIYFIRTTLSNHPCDVNWGHIIDISRDSCSPECDVIVHDRGLFARWNGGEKPIMDFLFIESKYVKAVVSCKSRLTAIDKDYPRHMNAHGINKVFLFAECCSHTNYANLRAQALQAGYSGLWCAYFTVGQEDEVVDDEFHHLDFWKTLRELYNLPHAPASSS